MTASVGFFTMLVVVALAVTTAAPIVLIALLLRDRARGELW